MIIPRKTKKELKIAMSKPYSKFHTKKSMRVLRYILKVISKEVINDSKYVFY